MIVARKHPHVSFLKVPADHSTEVSVFVYYEELQTALPIRHCTPLPKLQGDVAGILGIDSTLDSCFLERDWCEHIDTILLEDAYTLGLLIPSKFAPAPSEQWSKYEGNAGIDDRPYQAFIYNAAHIA